jgi:hypothetical protein
MLRQAILGLAALLAVGIGVLLLLPGTDRSAGIVSTGPRDADRTRADEAARARAAAAVGAPADRRILFGDLHVHTTFSIDALIYSLPMFGGEGAHPPADACDFARWCSDLDFFSLNDHAEGLTPARWQESIESVRACNAEAGDPADPDLVAYIGWEWTQASGDPATHYGHRNVLFPGLDDDEIPARPITALPDGTMDRAVAMGPARIFERLGRGLLGGWGDFLWLTAQMVSVPDCPPGLAGRQLPADCRENASTPRELHEKLARWQLPTLVIPHGLAWGLHAPPGASLDVALSGGHHDPELERLVEVYSGHGNSEEFRDVPEVNLAESMCPAPTEDFLPCCWRAGEIIRERCGDLPDDDCEERVVAARRAAAAAGNQWHRTIPDADFSDWLDCNNCRDCFKPAYLSRSRLSAQYGFATGDFSRVDADGRPARLRWGLIGSSDGHEGRPGTGYKQEDRVGMTDGRGYARESDYRRLRPWVVGTSDDPTRAVVLGEEPRGLRSLFDVERAASFMYPGGIVAVHSEGRERGAVWDALIRREAYGTSGPRILLWFDLLTTAGGSLPMGTETRMSAPPVFEVRAVGDFVQKPGCPDPASSGLTPERHQRLCRGACYHPGDARHPITAIEVVRIRPRVSADEPVAPLIEDPWKRIACPDDPAGCSVRFEDADFAIDGRDTVYYVRALQEPTPAINGANLRTRFDPAGNPTSVDPCYGDWRTGDDDCLAAVQERAWSSPIFVDFAARR